MQIFNGPPIFYFYNVKSESAFVLSVEKFVFPFIYPNMLVVVLFKAVIDKVEADDKLFRLFLFSFILICIPEFLTCLLLLLQLLEKHYFYFHPLLTKQDETAFNKG